MGRSQWLIKQVSSKFSLIVWNNHVFICDYDLVPTNLTAINSVDTLYTPRTIHQARLNMPILTWDIGKLESTSLCDNWYVISTLSSTRWLNHNPHHTSCARSNSTTGTATPVPPLLSLPPKSTWPSPTCTSASGLAQSSPARLNRPVHTSSRELDAPSKRVVRVYSREGHVGLRS